MLALTQHAVDAALTVRNYATAFIRNWASDAFGQGTDEVGVHSQRYM